MGYQKLGFGSALEAYEVTAGSVESCVSILNEGNLLAILPGKYQFIVYLISFLICFIGLFY